MPESRAFISQDDIKDPESVPEEIRRFVSELEPGYYLIRSAHPKESEFSGGAFESIKIYIYENDDVDARIKKICNARDKMIEMARLENSLQIRRDIKHLLIENYDPEEMGVYVNNLIPRKQQITVVPLSNGQLSLKYDNFESIDILRDCVPEQDVIRRVQNIWRGEAVLCRQKVKTIKNPVQLIKDIQKAQELFVEKQEMEIIIDGEGGYHFVQSRDSETESVELKEIPKDKFNKGMQTSLAMADKYMPYNGSSVMEKLRCLKKTDEIREVRVIRIDELRLLSDAKMFEYKGYSNELIEFSDFISLADGDRKAEIFELLKKQYNKLLKLAEQYRQYILLISNMAFFAKNRKDTQGVLIEQMRGELVKCASVQLRGKSDHESGSMPSYPHIMVSPSGPQQILITYGNEGYTRLFLPRIGPHRITADYGTRIIQDPIRTKIDKLQNGDKMLVMVKDGLSSLYPLN